MLVTEDEARKKWCPFARSTPDSATHASVNRQYSSGAPEPDCLCIGSQCMAWKWLNYDEDRGSCGLAEGR